MPYGKPLVSSPARKYLQNDHDAYHSPLLAVPAASSLLGGLGGRFESRAAKEGKRQTTYEVWAQEAADGDAHSLELLRQAGGVEVKGMPGPPWPHIAPSQGSKDTAAGLYRDAKRAMPKEKSALEETEGFIEKATPLGVGIAQAFARSGRRRSSYGYSSYGRRRRRPQYDEEDVGGGFQPADVANLGRSGGGKLASKLGKGALVVGAGVAAYLATKYLTEAFARGVKNKEEAGVAIAMANGKALRALQAQQGKPPTPAQRAEMKAAMAAKLVALGYDPVTLTRKRGAIESFFSGLEE